MKLPRRQFLHLAAGAAALPAVSRIAWAQAYPTRLARVIVPATAGGGLDVLARLMGQWLSDRLGQPFIIENRPGAGTNLGTEAVVRAPADGHTLLMIGVANAINATLYEKLNFNFIRDIAPVAGIMRGPQILVVNPAVPAKTVPEFIAYAKANPGKLNFASPGNGTSFHVAGEMFKMMAGVNMIHVPYRGGGPAVADLIGGQIPASLPRSRKVRKCKGEAHARRCADGSPGHIRGHRIRTWGAPFASSPPGRTALRRRSSCASSMSLTRC
jgi:tripartite-type tricarboxylate transporter receptor subunit TctC